MSVYDPPKNQAIAGFQVFSGGSPVLKVDSSGNIFVKGGVISNANAVELA